MSMLAGIIDAADAGSIGAEAAVGADVAASRPVGGHWRYPCAPSAI